MNIQQDFKELLALLEKHHVDYMIVGGYAVAFHGFLRFTKDLDIFCLFCKTRILQKSRILVLPVMVVETREGRGSTPECLMVSRDGRGAP